MFVSKKQLHFTVMMLKLYSEQKRHLAKQVCVSVCVHVNFALLGSCSCTDAVEALHPTYASRL